VARKAAGGPTKSELIRNYKSDHDDAGPTAIATALTKEGTKVTPAFVSTVLSNAKRKGRKGRRRVGRRVGRPAGGDPVQVLMQAKKMADQMGGIDKARSALDALARILS
jgi:hypothetical protein